MGYEFASVKRGRKEWVRGNVHTNSIEGFWSNVKHGLIGVYRGVSRKYLQRYLDEYTLRYNRRQGVTPNFEEIMQRIEHAG